MATVDQRRTRGRENILNAAAQLFYKRGYPQTSIRAIASAAAIESSSLYHHFASKEEILFAVEEEAFARLEKRVRFALKGVTDPWERLTVACVTHLRAILENREFIAVTVAELPQDQSKESQAKFLALRNRYEDIFRDLIADLDFNPNLSRKYFRLSLIGALAGSMIWYREDGDSPEDIARAIVSIMRQAADPNFGPSIESGGRTDKP